MQHEQMGAELRDELAKNNVKRLVDPRSLPVRFSRLKHIARSPLHYLHACQSTELTTRAARVGRGCHALALSGKVAIWDKKTETGRSAPRTGKKWDDFVADHPDHEILNGPEAEEAKAIAAAVKGHARASEILYTEGTLLEHEIKWKYMGREMVSHLDAYRPAVLVADLKSMEDGRPERVQKSALWDFLHVQLGMYVFAAEYVTQRTPDPFLIVVEKPKKGMVAELPLPVTVMPLSPRTLEAGRKQFHLWMERLLGCERANEWPAYSLSDVVIDVPERDEPFVGTYGGDEIEI